MMKEAGEGLGCMFAAIGVAILYWALLGFPGLAR